MALRDRPVLAAAAGAACIASSATLVRLADTAPATAATFRCLYALPFLGVLMLLEDRRLGPRPRRARLLAAGAGVSSSRSTWCSGITRSRPSGAGIATVLGNLQVVIVGFIAWWWLGERPSARLVAAVPVVLVGVVLISGVVGDGAYGDNPMLGVVFGAGTSIAYAGFLLVLRARQQGPASGRRPAVRCDGRGDGRLHRARSRVGWHRPGAVVAVARLAVHPRDHLAGGGLAADRDLAAAGAGRTHLGRAAAAAGRVRGAGRSRARRAAVGDPARRMRHRAGGGGGRDRRPAGTDRASGRAGSGGREQGGDGRVDVEVRISSPVGQTE